MARGNETILVVEDESALRELVVNILEPVSYTHLDVYKRQAPTRA